ncbi:MAG: hypothetical protein GXO72_01175, partial [Caldiserica bacterium]|nr:hypothetical protein [Caldisericota bacterium]
MRGRMRALSLLLAVGLLGAAGLSQRAELLIWRLPTANALPVGLSLAPSGKVYISQFRAQRIGLLDPVTNELSERDIGASPGSVYAAGDDAVVYALPMEDAIEYLVFIGGQARWQVPTAGSWPKDLTPSPSGPGQINLWLVERTGGKVARLSPAQIAVTLPLFYPQKQTIPPQRQEITPTVTTVAPAFYPGNPLLPPPLALVQSRATGDFTEWDVTGYQP